jgi:hypothetical protein
MKVAEFLKQISDEEGPLQTSATDLMERMGRGDFNELIRDMRWLSALTWRERDEASEGLDMGGEFHPTNKNHD